MKVEPIKSDITFKSGHATFGSSGHLSYKPDVVFEHIYYTFKPTGGLLSKEEPNKLDYFA